MPAGRSGAGAPPIASTVMTIGNIPRTQPMHSARLTRPGLRAPLLAVTVLALLAAATAPARETLFLAVARAAESSPLASLVGLVADRGLLLLVAVTAVAAVLTWLRDRRRFWTLVTAGAGTVAAYLISEGVKLVVTEPRPCRTLDIQSVLTCPAPGDWSWPSNHSVLAAAFATACALTVPALGKLVFPLALIVAASRIAAGVHYPHDVLSGLALGVLVVAVTVTLLHPLANRLSRGPRARSRAQ